ncbi:hypothetical protein ABPG72_010933 [Tetrahymena utriculariae]
MKNQSDVNINNQTENLDPKCLFYQSKNSNLIQITNRVLNITGLEEQKSNSSYCNFFDSEAKVINERTQKKLSKISNENILQIPSLNNVAQSSDKSIGTSIKQQVTQNLKAKKKKNIRDILLSKRQILEQQNAEIRRGSSANFIQSFIIQRVFKKAKVHLVVKKFATKMVRFLQTSKHQVFFQSKRMRSILSDKSDAIAALAHNSDQINSLNRSDMLSQNSQSNFSFTQSNYNILAHFLQQKLDVLIKNIPIFDQLSQYRIIWDIIQLISLTFFFVLIPLCICFDFTTYIEIFYIALIFVILLISDLLVNFNTTIFYRGKVINSRSEIIQTYMNNGMKRDCLTLLPLFMLICLKFQDLNLSFQYQSYISVIYFLFYLRLEKFQVFQQRIEIRFHLSPKISQLMNLWSLLFLNIYIIHFLACSWILLSKFEHIYGQSFTWLDKQNVGVNDYLSQYLYSFYFNTVTMVTVGYGDISPQTHVEKIMSILTVLSACGVFAYSISEVGSIFQEMQKSQKLIKNNMYVINNYMKQRRISYQLQHKIRHYLEYYWNESEFSSIKQEQRIINQLSDNLRENLLIEANKVFILESPILKKNFSMQTLLKTISIAQEQKFTPQEVIFLKGDMEFSIYFIERGSVEVQIEGFNFNQQKQNKNIQLILKQGQFFGEGSFFTGSPRRSTFRSLEFTTLLKIDREEFIKIIEESKEDYEMFCYIKDQIILNGSTQFSRKCELCQSDDQPKHNENNCPFLHFIPNTENLQNRFIYQAKNTQRIKKSRRCYKFKQNLVQLREIQDDQIKYVDQNSSFINEMYELKDQINQISKTKTNLSFSSEEIDSEEDEDDILSIKNHTKNQSEKSIKSNGFINSLGLKQNLTKKDMILAHAIRQFSEQEQQISSLVIEKNPNESRKQSAIRRASFQVPITFTNKNLILKEGIDQLQNKVQEKEDKFQLESNLQQTSGINQQQQANTQEIVDQNHQNRIQGNNITNNNNNNEKIYDQRKTSKPFKKGTLLQNRNSIIETNNQALDDFNISSQKYLKKYSSKQSIQYYNNFSALNQSNYQNQFESFQEIENFDKMHIFEIYFPFNNYDYIIPNIQKKLKFISKNKRNNPFLDQKYKSNFEVSALSKSQRSLRKSISASKLNLIQNSPEKQNNGSHYKILLNGQEKHDSSKLMEQDNYQNSKLLSPTYKSLKDKNSFEESDNDEKASQILGLTRVNILPWQTQLINSRKSFFNRKSTCQTIKVKHSLSQQLQNISQRNILQNQ